MSAPSTLRDKAQAMSGAGLLVVLSLCFSLLIVIITVCVMAYHGKEIPDALDRVLQGLLIGVPALLAKTYRDAQREPSSDPSDEPPTPVELVQETPVVTREVGPADAVGGADPVGGDAVVGVESRRRR